MNISCEICSQFALHCNWGVSIYRDFYRIWILSGKSLCNNVFPLLMCMWQMRKKSFQYQCDIFIYYCVRDRPCAVKTIVYYCRSQWNLTLDRASSCCQQLNLILLVCSWWRAVKRWIWPCGSQHLYSPQISIGKDRWLCRCRDPCFYNNFFKWLNMFKTVFNIVA